MSRLLENGKQYRDTLLSKNVFTNNDEYRVGHSRAQSDGDEHGKGQVQPNGTIGSITDINTRDGLEAKNLYTQNKPYDISQA